MKYRETSMFRHHLFPRNMTELRIWQSFKAAAPPPSKQCWNRVKIYMSNSHCNNASRPTCVSCANKIQHKCDKNIILLFQIYLQNSFIIIFVHLDFIYEKCR